MKVGTPVVYHINPQQCRGGQLELAALVSRDHGDGVVDLVVFPAQSEMFHDTRLRRRTEANPWPAWSPVVEDVAEPASKRAVKA